MKKNLLLASLLAVGVSAQAQYYLGFIPPTNAVSAGVTKYSAWYFPTNVPVMDATATKMNECPAGATNLDIPAWVQSGVLISMLAETPTAHSAWSVPILYDPLAVEVTNAPPLLPGPVRGVSLFKHQ